MIAEFGQLALSLLVAGVLMVGLGGATTWQLPMSKLLRLAAAAPVSLLLVFGAAEVSARAGIAWSPLAPLAAAAALAALTALVMIPVRRRRRESEAGGSSVDRSGEPRVLRWSLLIAAVMIFGVFLLAMGSPTAISQTYDNTFHMTAIKRIIDTGNPSAWMVGGISLWEGQTSYYPAVWHQASSLIVLATGSEIWIAQNALMFVIACLVWPLGLLAMARHGLGLGTAGLLVTAIFAGVFAGYPIGLGSFGILLPLFLAVSMIPLLLTLLTQLLGVAVRPGAAWPVTLIMGGAVALAVAVAHPQAIHMTLALAVPIIAWAVLFHLVGRRWLAGLGALVLFASVAAGGALVWLRLRPSMVSAAWTAPDPWTYGLRKAVAMNWPNAAPEMLMIALLAGSVLITACAWRGRRSFLILPYVVGVALYFAGLAIDHQPLRYLLTGPFYSDYHRIAAVPVIAAIPMIAAAAQRVSDSWTGPRATAAGAAGLVLLLVLGSGYQRTQWFMAEQWSSGMLVDEDEMELLQQLPDYVPEDAVIATNALNGSSLAYSISDRQVLNETIAFRAGPAVHLLNAELDEANTNPHVCDAMHALNVEYALDFGPEEVDGRYATYTGLNEISETGAAEVVLEVGDKRLLKMQPCEGTDGVVR